MSAEEKLDADLRSIWIGNVSLETVFCFTFVSFDCVKLLLVFYISFYILDIHSLRKFI